MRGFATSPNPFTRGMRPRRFFSSTKDLMNYGILIKGATKNDYIKIYKIKGSGNTKTEELS